MMRQPAGHLKLDVSVICHDCRDMALCSCSANDAVADHEDQGDQDARQWMSAADMQEGDML